MCRCCGLWNSGSGLCPTQLIRPRRRPRGCSCHRTGSNLHPLPRFFCGCWRCWRSIRAHLSSISPRRPLACWRSKWRRYRGAFNNGFCPDEVAAARVGERLRDRNGGSWTGNAQTPIPGLPRCSALLTCAIIGSIFPKELHISHQNPSTSRPCLIVIFIRAKISGIHS